MLEQLGLQAHSVGKTFGRGRKQHRALLNVDFTFSPGARIGVVGESGSGKSTLGRLLTGLDRVSAGRITFDGKNVNEILRSPSSRIEFRRAVQFVAQDTSSSFDPLRRLRHAVRVPAQQLAGLDSGSADHRVNEVLEALGLPEYLADRYPNEVSGGQRQRFAIARAIVVRPQFLICDEVVSALDASVQGQVLNLLKRYCIDSGAGLLFISHGLPATAFVSSEITVMYRGEIAELGTTPDIIQHSDHPYTKSLLAAHSTSREDKAFDKITEDSPSAAVQKATATGVLFALSQFARHQRWWLGRLIALPAQLLVFALIAFLLVRMIPGDPVRTITGGQATPEKYAAVQKSLGLDGSLLHQLDRYFMRLMHLDLGRSLLTRRSLQDEFALRLPGTLELAAMALIASIAITLLFSYIAALHPRSIAAAVIRVYARAAGAIPDFAVGVLGIYVFYAVLRWAPAPLGRLDLNVQPPPHITGFPFLDAVLSGNGDAIVSMTRHLILPILVMVIAHSAIMLKQLLSGLEAELDRPATLFRIATGAPSSTVLLSVYRRALPAAVTMAGIVFGYQVGGAVIIEGLFGFNGMGIYLTDAVSGADFTAMQGFLVVIAAVSLLVFLVVDLCNMLIDPRRRPGIQQGDGP